MIRYPNDFIRRYHVTIALDGTLPLTEIDGMLIYCIPDKGIEVLDYSRWEIEIIGNSGFAKLIKGVDYAD